MGLDMYLNNSKKEEVMYWRKANAIHGWFIRNCQLAKRGEEEVGPYLVKMLDIKCLKDDCEKVLKIIGDNKPTKKDKVCVGCTIDKETKEMKKIYQDQDSFEDDIADELAEILPTHSGFFFGSLKYDEAYVYDIKITLKRCEELIKSYAPTSAFKYYASW